jgi:hypothetical protein
MTQSNKKDGLNMKKYTVAAVQLLYFILKIEQYNTKYGLKMESRIDLAVLLPIYNTLKME